jgi:tetratricopeptide (TPR) repeat protein
VRAHYDDHKDVYEINLALGYYYAVEDNRQNAEVLQRNAVKFGGETPLTHYLSGVLAGQRESSHAQAIKDFEAAIEAEPDFVRARYDLGMLHHRMGNKDQAKAAMEAILEQHPDHVKAKQYLEGKIPSDKP